MANSGANSKWLSGGLCCKAFLGVGAWRIIPLSEWLRTMVSKSRTRVVSFQMAQMAFKWGLLTSCTKNHRKRIKKLVKIKVPSLRPAHDRRISKRRVVWDGQNRPYCARGFKSHPEALLPFWEDGDVLTLTDGLRQAIRSTSHLIISPPKNEKNPPPPIKSS